MYTPFINAQDPPVFVVPSFAAALTQWHGGSLLWIDKKQRARESASLGPISLPWKSERLTLSLLGFEPALTKARRGFSGKADKLCRQ